MKYGKRFLAGLLSGLLIFGSVPAAKVHVFAAEAAAKSITALTVEGRSNPLGIDTKKPMFGWQMKSDAIGAAQSAYQIVVKDMAGTVVWDSGKVESKESQNIRYAGTEPLAPKTAYTWQVTVTDETGAAVTSEEAHFETSLMDETLSSWNGAEWIGSDKMFYDSTGDYYFTLDASVQFLENSNKASIIFGADDYRLQNKAQNIWGSEGENYFKYEIDASDAAKPKLNIYLVGMPIAKFQGQTTHNVYTGEEEEVLTPFYSEKAKDEPYFSVDIPAGTLKMDAANAVKIHAEAGVVTCEINGTVVDGSRQVDPLGAGTDYNSYPNLNSIGFAVPAGQKAAYTDVRIEYPGKYQESYAVGDLFGKDTGATYEIFRTMTAASGSTAAKDAVSVNGGTITVTGGTNGFLGWADPSYGSEPMVRSEFTVQEKTVEKARLYATAQGLYEVYMNGSRVDDGRFHPGNEEYATSMPYQVYDVTKMVKSGANAIGAQLAEGWWSGFQTYTLGNYSFYGAKPAFLAMLEITYSDGTTDVVTTNTKDWKVCENGPVESAELYNGERYNAQTAAAMEGWDNAGYNDSSWRTPIIISPRQGSYKMITRYDEQAAVVKELDAASSLGEARPGTKTYIYDMGENVIGVPKITIPSNEYADAGTELIIRYGEILYPDLEEYKTANTNGLLMVENLRAALATDFYTVAAGEQTFEPRFTFHGYRYVEITGLKKELPKENVKTEVLSSVHMTATYDSSNADVNRLFKNVQNSQTSNFLSLPTDCPQRNERLGWTGDAQVFSQAAAYNTQEAYNFYRNWLKSLRADQNKDGSLPAFAPTFEPTGDTVTSWAQGTSWDAALIAIPYNLYMMTGNTEIIEENIDAIDKYFGYQAANPLEGYPALTSKTGLLADWLSIDPTSADLVNNAVYVYLEGITAEMAAAIGKTDLVTKYQQKYEEGKKQWNQKYWNAKTGKPNAIDGTENDTETAYATPLRYGIIADENIPKAVENYVAAVKKAGYTITSGFSGTPNLVPVLTKYGYVDDAYKLFEQTEYASWLYPVKNGATSVWERWNSYTVENGFGGNNAMNSFNHFSLGAITEWMMGFQLGITTDTPGYQDFVLQPVPGGSFSYAKGSIDTNYGTIESGWTADGGVLTSYHATIPANTQATLYLPATGLKAAPTAPEGAEYKGTETRNSIKCHVYALKSGSYAFTAKKGADTVTTVKKSITLSKKTLKVKTLAKKDLKVKVKTGKNMGKVAVKLTVPKAMKSFVKKSGKTITFKKGCPKGTVKVKVTVKASGNNVKTTKTLKIKVK